MLLAVVLISVADDRRLRGRAARARPFPVDGRDHLRIHCRHDSRQRRRGRHEVLPADLLAVHVHLRLEPRRHHPLRLHDFEPDHRHGDAGAAGVLHRADLRPLQERPEILQDLRAVGHSDLRPAGRRLHRNLLVLPAADLAQRASVRQHAGRPHRAEGVRGLRRDARRLARRRRLDRRRAAAGADDCDLLPSKSWSRSCRPMCLRS